MFIQKNTGNIVQHNPSIKTTVLSLVINLLHMLILNIYLCRLFVCLFRRRCDVNSDALVAPECIISGDNKPRQETVRVCSTRWCVLARASVWEETVAQFPVRLCARALSPPRACQILRILLRAVWILMSRNLNVIGCAVQNIERMRLRWLDERHAGGRVYTSHINTDQNTNSSSSGGGTRFRLSVL